MLLASCVDIVPNPVTSVLGMVVAAVIADVPLPTTYPVKVDAPVPPLATGTVPTNWWSAFQSLGSIKDASPASGMVDTLVCFTVIAIIELRLFYRLVPVRLV